ncbi:MAG: hypothetical protein HKN91_11965 [Acidimicrobiia bacterium]|nr:hypothetical protein [Acidimicrobiia bacterium]
MRNGVETAGEELMKQPAITLSQRLLALALGAGFIALGTLGLLLPVLPGWLFFIAGAISLASAIPALRRFTSRIVMSGPARKIVDSAAKSHKGRRLIAGAMRLPHLRRGLMPPARWQVVRTLLRRSVTDEQGGDR